MADCTNGFGVGRETGERPDCWVFSPLFTALYGSHFLERLGSVIRFQCYILKTRKIYYPRTLSNVAEPRVPAPILRCIWR